MGGFVLFWHKALGFCPRGVLSQRGFVLEGFCPEVFCPRGFCPRGVLSYTRIPSIIRAISQILLLLHDFLCSVLTRYTERNIAIPTGFNTLILVLRKTSFSQIRVNPPRSPLRVSIRLWVIFSVRAWVRITVRVIIIIIIKHSAPFIRVKNLLGGADKTISR